MGHDASSARASASGCLGGKKRGSRRHRDPLGSMMLWDLGLRPGTPGHGEELEPLLDEEVRVHLGRDEIHPSGERALRPLLRFYRALADRCRRSSRAAPPARSKGRIEKMSPTAGRVLTEAIRSPGPIPGDNRAAMDGFSVQASVFLGASSTIQFGCR